MEHVVPFIPSGIASATGDGRTSLVSWLTGKRAVLESDEAAIWENIIREMSVRHSVDRRSANVQRLDAHNLPSHVRIVLDRLERQGFVELRAADEAPKIETVDLSPLTRLPRGLPAYMRSEAAYRINCHLGFEDAWEGAWTNDPEAQPKLVAELLRDSPAPAHGTALDVGCGEGRISRVLAQRGYRVCGVDVSETAIRLARKRLAGSGRLSAFICGDATDLGLLAGRFDVVVDWRVHHCILDNDRRRKHLANLGRVLSPGGVLLFMSFLEPSEDVPPASDEELRFYVRKNDRAYTFELDNPRLTSRFATREEYQREFRAAGLQILEEPCIEGGYYIAWATKVS